MFAFITKLFRIDQGAATQVVMPGNSVLAQTSNSTATPINMINEAIVTHLNMQTNGALMITGDWGSGKTHYIKRTILPLIEEQHGKKTILVSVYGEKDKQSIAQRVVFSYWDKYTDTAISTEKVFKGLTKLASSLPIITKYVNVDKLIMGNGDNLLKLLPHDELLICFDDVERISDKLDINDFLGLVNELVENTGAKVIIIANNKKFHRNEDDEKTSKKLIYIEKTVEKIVHYLPNMAEVLDRIAESYPDGDFRQFLSGHKSWLLSTITVKEEFAALKELRINLANIRTLKFAIEHFRLVFEAVTSLKTSTEQANIEQLKSCWLFTLSISVIFRNNEISIDDSRYLEEGKTTLMDLDLAEMFKNTGRPDTTTATEPVKDPRDFAENFRKEFYERLGESYRYYREIYLLITGGQSIDPQVLNEDLDKKFYVHGGRVNPAQELLGKFLSGVYWNFKDDEIKDAVIQLLDYVHSGELEDPVSFLNAGGYLLEFSKILEKTPDEITAIIRTGLDLRLSQVSSSLIEDQLVMISGEFKNPYLQDLIKFIASKSDQVEKEEIKTELLKLEDLFVNNPKGFIEFLMPKDNRIRTPDKPVFQYFSNETAEKGWGNWHPDDLMKMNKYLDIRYNPNSFLKELVPELPFLHTMHNTMANFKDELKPLSTHVIHKFLLPKLKIYIKVLESAESKTGKGGEEK